jgi:hypothetical protein
MRVSPLRREDENDGSVGREGRTVRTHAASVVVTVAVCESEVEIKERRLKLR